MMAAFVEILKNEFPQIDSELFDYITGTVQIYDINTHTVFDALYALLVSGSASMTRVHSLYKTVLLRCWSC